MILYLSFISPCCSPIKLTSMITPTDYFYGHDETTGLTGTYTNSTSAFAAIDEDDDLEDDEDDLGDDIEIDEVDVDEADIDEPVDEDPIIEGDDDLDEDLDFEDDEEEDDVL